MNIIHALLSGALFVVPFAQAQVPSLIHFQGRMTVNGTPFSGTGQFKFALVNGNGSTTYWSNDGTSSAGSQPSAAVSLSVTLGLYSVLLGDTTIPNMTQAIGTSVFANSDVRLRAWFNDGATGFQQLSPDQRVAAVGYALVAQTAYGVANGAVATGQLANGAVTQAKLDSTFSADLPLLDGTQTFSGMNHFTSAGNSFSGNGASLTSLNANNISSGTVPNAAINWASPGNLGSTTPGSGTFTTLSASYVGIGTVGPWERLHIEDGNVVVHSTGEREIRVQRDFTGITPAFKLGRIITAGDGSPEFRVLFTADPAHVDGVSVFEFDSKGIVASVKTGLGSHFEGFIGTSDPQPVFRLNSYPSMQLELGAGGASLTDVKLRRVDSSTLAVITGPLGSEVERLRVSSSGNVGIGTASPNFQLELSQDSAAKPGGGSWANTSDGRLKKNIQPIAGALDKLTQLRGVTFEWMNPEDHAHQTGQQGGFVAQEVEEVFPNWVREVPGGEHDKELAPGGRVKSLALPFEFDALVVESIKELEAENQVLKAQNANLMRRLEDLEAKVR